MSFRSGWLGIDAGVDDGELEITLVIGVGLRGRPAFGGVRDLRGELLAEVGIVRRAAVADAGDVVRLGVQHVGIGAQLLHRGVDVVGGGDDHRAELFRFLLQGQAEVAELGAGRAAITELDDDFARDEGGGRTELGGFEAHLVQRGRRGGEGTGAQVRHALAMGLLQPAIRAIEAVRAAVPIVVNLVT